MAYKDHKRETEEINLKIARFTVDGRPACISWFGDENNEREMCRFYMTSGLGTRSVCGLTLKKLEEYTDITILKPNSDCPIWEENKEKEESK